MRAHQSALSVAILVTTACQDPRRPIAGLDTLAVPADSVTGPTAARADVIRLLGTPSYEELADPAIPGPPDIHYAIRTEFFPNVIRAAVLQIQFDSAGHVAQWGFVEPRSHRPLPITETVEQAEQWFGMLCREGSIIRLNSVLTPQATRETVATAFRPYWPSTKTSQASFPRIHRNGKTELWEYDADRPSPLFIEPFDRDFMFDSLGHVAAAAPNGYGICPRRLPGLRSFTIALELTPLVLMVSPIWAGVFLLVVFVSLRKWPTQEGPPRSSGIPVLVLLLTPILIVVFGSLEYGEQARHPEQHWQDVLLYLLLLLELVAAVWLARRSRPRVVGITIGLVALWYTVCAMMVAGMSITSEWL